MNDGCSSRPCCSSQTGMSLLCCPTAFGVPTCVSNATSALHCGTCGNTCAPDQGCLNRVCQSMSTPLPPPTLPPSGASLAVTADLPLPGAPLISTCQADGTTPVPTLAPSCAETINSTNVTTTSVTIPASVMAGLVPNSCLRVSVCGTAAVPGAQLDLPWVIPQNFTTAPPAPLIPSGTRNCPDAASNYSQILIWPATNSTANTTGIQVGEVVNVQSISGCVPDIRMTVSVDFDCNITTMQ
jgi:hypothetical protein